MNKVILIGRLTKDPELKTTNTGVSVVPFTLAVNRPFANENGERQADFINCVAWRNQAENLSKFMKKGSLIGVEGSFQVRSYEDTQGNKRIVTEVIAERIEFLQSAKQDADIDDDISGDDLPF